MARFASGFPHKKGRPPQAAVVHIVLRRRTGAGNVSELLHGVGGVLQPVALEVLDAALVHERRQGGVDGHLCEDLQVVTLGGLLAPALAEEEMCIRDRLSAS